MAIIAKKKRRQRRSATDRRREIVQAALELMAERGFEETSFRRIADRCKITQSAVLHHFSSRELLLEAVLDEILRHNHVMVEAAMVLSDSALDRLRKYFQTTLRWAVEFSDESRVILLLYYHATFAGRFASMYERILEGARTRIKGYLLAAIREGALAKDVEVDIATRLCHDVLLGGVVNALTSHPRTSASEMEKRWEYLFGFLKRT